MGVKLGLMLSSDF